MNCKIIGYTFEVERSICDGKGFIEVDSLKSAIKELSFNGVIKVICHFSIEDRVWYYKTKLCQEDIAHRSEQEIYERLDKEVEKQYFS